MALSFDHGAKRIVVSSPQNSVTVQALLDAIRDEEASALGIANDQIANASGKELLDTGVQVGITLKLLGAWQLQWWAGNYTAKIGGGNLVAESGDPVAYVVGGPQVEITLSAAATIVQSGGGSAPTAGEVADAVLARNLAGGADGGRTVRDALRAGRNRVSIDPTTGAVTVYEEDDTTPAWTGTASFAQRDAVREIDPA